MLESLSPVEKYVLYEALLHAIRTDFRIGFHNQDTDHPVYGLGIDGELMPGKDSPSHNIIFKLMHEISKSELKGEALTIHEPVYCWADFCRMVVSANRKNEK